MCLLFCETLSFFLFGNKGSQITTSSKLSYDTEFFFFIFEVFDEFNKERMICLFKYLQLFLELSYLFFPHSSYRRLKDLSNAFHLIKLPHNSVSLSVISLFKVYLVLHVVSVFSQSFGLRYG